MEIKNLDKVLDKILDDLADYIFSNSQQNLINNGSVDTGFMLKTANVQRKFMHKKIVYPAPYSAFVEFGTQPHMPPVNSLIKWAQHKLKVKNPEKVAWAIATKIKQEGIEPKPFLRPAIHKAQTHFKPKL